jgi:uncharacterized protein YdhG (YjbR/CyaY superfamily)
MVTLVRVTEIARELPEVEEWVSWGSPCFKGRGTTFAGLTTRHDGAI